MAFCPNFSGLLVADTGAGKVLLARVRCKAWDCPHCAQLNRAIWKARLIYGINEIGKDWSFWTITAHRKMRGYDASLISLREAWGKLYHRLKRTFGAFQYARIYEPHKDGSLHIHVISTIIWPDIRTGKRKNGERFSYSRWLKDTVPVCGGGYQTDAKNLEGHAGYVAGYVVKYMTKEISAFKRVRGRVRRIQTCQKWPKSELTADDGSELEWVLKDALYIEDCVGYWQAGKQIVDISTGQIVDSDVFDTWFFYPPEFASVEKAGYD